MKKFLKIGLLIVAAIFLSAATSIQNAPACCFSKICTGQKDYNFIATDDVRIANSVVYPDEEYLKTYGMLYLKFDISSIGNNEKIEWAQLKLYAKENDTYVKAYHVDYDEWTESTISGTAPPAVEDLMATQNEGLGDWHWVTWNLSNYDLSGDVADGFLSIALDDGFNYSYSLFKATEHGCYPPELIIKTCPAPAPEPSSMLLGLMGLGSALGLKRKKKQ